MNMKFFWATLLCLFCIRPSCAQTRHVNHGSKAEMTSLAGIKQAVLQGRIIRCEVFYMPSDVETVSALDPGAVEHVFRYEMGIGFLSSHSKLMTGFCRAVEETKVGPPVPYHGNFRRGFKFFDYTGKKVYSVFLDDTGKIAVVNGKRIYIQGSIYSWFNSNFSDHFDALAY